jgi:hypothetical protein
VRRETATEAHGLDGAGGRADEGDARIRASLGEVFVFAQETITGVHGLRARGFRGGQDDVGPEVAVFGRRAANVNGFVAGTHVGGLGIGIGINRDGADAEAAGRGSDAAGDLSSVCNKDSFKHERLPRQDHLRMLRIPGNLTSSLRRFAAGRPGWQ